VAGAGVGAAATGLRPVVDLMFGTFLYLAFDQIANQAGAMRYMFGGQTTLPLVYMVQNGSGASAGHHHSQSVHPFFMNMPLIKVIMPSTPYDVKGLLKAAIRDDNPVVFLNHLALGGQRGEVPDDEYTIPIGQGEIRRAGCDVTICAAGLMVHHSLKAAKTLEAEGIDAEVIDLRTLKPWDEALVLQSVGRTGRFVAVDESYPVCGAASEWAATVAEKAFASLRAPVQRVSSRPVPIPFSPVLEKAVIPSPDDIAAAAKRALGVQTEITQSDQKAISSKQ
jgi:pyruvate dehydrogenase E1 component beta subunit